MQEQIIVNIREKLNVYTPSLSSTIKLRSLVLFLPPRNHLPISLVVLLYFFSRQVSNLKFLDSLLSSILCICPLQFILYCVNLSLILKMPNVLLCRYYLFCPKVYILPLVLKISFQQLQFSFCLIGLGTSPHCLTSEQGLPLPYRSEERSAGMPRPIS